MGIKINTNISSKFTETSITIESPTISEEIQSIIKYISNMGESPNQIIANKNNEIYFIDLEKIVCFFSENKSNYVRTGSGTYKIRYRLYELEEKFRRKDFIRISHSCIINVKQVLCFDTSILGTVLVRLRDNTEAIVSKRNVSQVMEFLRERGKLI